MSGSLVDIGDTQLYVDERGTGVPLFVLHGGPGLDHTMFGDLLDPLGDACRLLLVDQRGQGRSGPSDPATWTLAQMAADVSALAKALRLDRYVVLGHSFGAFVALQHAVDFSGQPAATIISSGVASDATLMSTVEANLAAFEPVELRDVVTSSWEREQTATSPEEVLELLGDQLPFHFRDPLDPRIAEMRAQLAGGVYSPDVLRHFASEGYGAIDLVARLPGVRHPVLVLSGRADRTCSVEGGEQIAAGIPGAQFVVFERSGHMTYLEENGPYLRAVSDFLGRHDIAFSQDAASFPHRP
ncbi:MAG: alpha/beta fold hydrolase [Solirubrobacteraceae bacterium]